MLPDLKLVIRLQEIDHRLAELTREITSLPKHIAEIEKKLTSHQRKLAALTPASLPPLAEIAAGRFPATLLACGFIRDCSIAESGGGQHFAEDHVDPPLRPVVELGHSFEPRAFVQSRSLEIITGHPDA